MGELEQSQGTVHIPAGRIRCGYVGQSPWVIGGTVRDNVLLGAPMDEARYRSVLHACALLPDVAAMPHGDLTRVGDRGTSLSGGQRARWG